MRLSLISSSMLLTAFFAVTTQGGEIVRLKAGNTRLVPMKAMMEKLNPSEVRSFNNSLSAKSEFVVQFRSPITEADKTQIRSMGFKVRSYLPDDALVIEGNGATVLKLEEIKKVRAVSPFLADWKMSEDLGQTSVFNKDQRLRLHIRLTGADVLARVQSSLTDIENVDVRAASDKMVIADVPRSALNRVAQVTGVEWMETLKDYKTLDFNPDVLSINGTSVARSSRTGYESGTKIMGFDNAWARGYNGQGQMVAMADTGLDTGDLKTLHADLRGTTVKGESKSILPLTWADTNGHGTHVAGSVVGNGSSSSGLIKGGANAAQFYAQGIMMPFLGILDPFVLQDPKKLLTDPYAAGARIHTNSWGADTNGAYDALASAFDDFMWNNPDLLVVFAAGNSGKDANADGRIDEGSVGSPGTAKNVMTVGASENYVFEGGIQNPVKDLKQGEGSKIWPAEPIASDRLSDNANGMAAFSSRGPAQDGRIKPDVVAPGTNIVSTRSSQIQADPNNPKAALLWGEYDQHYLYCGGTSMATPLAAGAATVARQYIVSQGVNNPSAALVKAALMHTAFDLYPGQYGSGPKQEHPTPRPNNHQGYGRVDMDRLTSLGYESRFIDERAGVAVGEVKEFEIDASNGLIATLSYTDAPAAANAAKALVNDIDLEVIAPNGQTISKADRINNNEMVELTSGGPGLYKVIVKGVNVPTGKNGKQPFGLVITAL